MNHIIAVNCFGLNRDFKIISNSSYRAVCKPLFVGRKTLTLLCLYLLQLVTCVNCRNDHLKRIFKNHIIKIFDLKIDLARPLIKIQLVGEVFSTRNTVVHEHRV